MAGHDTTGCAASPVQLSPVIMLLWVQDTTKVAGMTNLLHIGEANITTVR